MLTKINVSLGYNPPQEEERPIFFLKLRFNYKHERFYRDFEGFEHVIDVRPIGSSPGLCFQIHPRSLVHPSRCFLHIHDVLSSFILDDGVRAYLTQRIAPFLIATARIQEWPLLGFYAVADVEIISQEFIDAREIISVIAETTMVDGGYVFDDMVGPIGGGASRLGIENLKRSSFYHQRTESHGGSGGGECPICLEDLNGVIKVIKMPRCSHIFHENCILRWLENRNSCPLCRRQVE